MNKSDLLDDFDQRIERAASVRFAQLGLIGNRTDKIRFVHVSLPQDFWVIILGVVPSRVGRALRRSGFTTQESGDLARSVLVPWARFYTSPISATQQKNKEKRAFRQCFSGAASPLTSPSIFGAGTYDSGLLLLRAIPEAAKKAKPGTPEFRAALRDALETTKEMVTSQGVVSMSPTDHSGFDYRGRVLVTVKDGKFVMVKE